MDRSSETTVYAARRILTMAPMAPDAEAIAVRDGRILAVGSLEDVAAWSSAPVDRTFADCVLMPGLV
ncbi:amidohydrolase, partial [Tritonibacter sp. SIMBA_163]